MRSRIGAPPALQHGLTLCLRSSPGPAQSSGLTHTPPPPSITCALGSTSLLSVLELSAQAWVPTGGQAVLAVGEAWVSLGWARPRALC